METCCACHEGAVQKEWVCFFSQVPERFEGVSVEEVKMWRVRIGDIARGEGQGTYALIQWQPDISKRKHSYFYLQ